MNDPSDTSITTSQVQANELSAQELDKVTGGDGKAPTKPCPTEPRPKETVTFEYGGLQVNYSPQNPD